MQYFGVNTARKSSRQRSHCNTKTNLR